jgi:hypothetical protein
MMPRLLRRRCFLGATISAASLLTLPVSAAESKHESSLSRGVAWLLAQQAKDGGWHSETYGALRLGAATTATTIYALSHLRGALLDKNVKDALARGWEFLQPGIKQRGFVACPDGSLDYPTYGTAMLATAARNADFGMSPEQRAKFIDWVASGQLHESREFTLKSPHYGGWDLMGASQVKGLTSDTNVSCTSYALEAIASADAQGQKELSREHRQTLARARRWAERCQDLRGDGGFWFSPDTSSINHKAGWHDEQQTKPKTYASATADGLRCLRAATGEPVKDDKHIAAAEKYLAERTEVAHVPGFEQPDDMNGWGLGLRFYYYQSLAKAMPVDARWAVDRRVALREELVRLQAKDGRWQNESARMREDDPLIATCLAVIALASL